MVKTYVIGRSSGADILLVDSSVASRHAELVVTDDQRYHLTDCGTGSKTLRLIERADGHRQWLPLRQAFVGAAESIRFGDCRCTVAELLRSLESAASPGTGEGPARDRILGQTTPVQRDPGTGEIIRKRP